MHTYAEKPFATSGALPHIGAAKPVLVLFGRNWETAVCEPAFTCWLRWMRSFKAKHGQYQRNFEGPVYLDILLANLLL